MASVQIVDELRAANARFRSLLAIGLDLSSEPDPIRLLRRAGAAARHLFGAADVTIGVIDLNDGTVQYLLSGVADGAGGADRITTGAAVPAIFRPVVAGRRTLRGDTRSGDSAGWQWPVPHPALRTFLAAPIASPAAVYGWMCLVGREDATFADDDEPLLAALSAQVGRMYEKLALLAAARQRSDEIEHEILERQQAELTARHERDRAQRCLDVAQVILLSLDLDGRITLINRCGCELLGWTERELLGRDFLDTCLPARTRVALRHRFHHVLDGDGAAVETPVLTRSGGELLVEWRNTLLRDDAGRVIGTFSSGTDITARHRAVEALRTAEERMRFALQNANVGVWDMNYRTGTLRWSETVEAQYGVPPGTFAGTIEAFVARVHPDDRAGVRETFRKAAESGADFSFHHRSIWPDGTVRWLSGAGRVQLGDHGEPVRGVGTSVDDTERRALEEQYLQSQKMEAIALLAGGVAHDFNNLLTEILGHCELLLADLDPDDTRQADISEIQKAGARAAGLTRQLMAFSRKEAIEPTVLDLNVVVGGIREMLGRLIGDDVSVALKLGPELARIKADHGQVEQVLMNLAVNARDAMPRGGTLRIETANVNLDGRETMTGPVAPGPYVALTVADTGTGMTAPVQARLFEPFFTTKGPVQGTGLGLATVDGIVRRSGGGIDVCSEIGRGTSFTVYFPQSLDAVTAIIAPPPIVPPPIRIQTVLVVDDAAALCELTRRLLQRLGYAVLVAATGDEALRVFAENAAIDVLLTDVVMPGTSGPELTRRLVEQRPTLKVIYMSGYTEDVISQHGVIGSGIAFLHKPFTSATLGGKIREVMGQC
ncbi:MAG: PAS domain-containing protein [Acidobacteriota bacterium]